jgi:hypothetical protein
MTSSIHFSVSSPPADLSNLIGSEFSSSSPQSKAKTLLLGIRDLRNRRAHDNPIAARELYRLADLCQQFFEGMPAFRAVIVPPFDQLRLQALEMLVVEEQ